MSELIRQEHALDPYMPRDAAQAMEMARMLAASGLLGKTPPKPESVLMLMVRGHGLGMPVGQSIFAFDIIDGVPTLKAESQQALCLAKPHICERFAMVESTAEQATYVAQRRGEKPVTLTYTMDDAKTARLTEKDNWKKNPKAMLRARCITAIGQVVFPDLLLGINSPDEQAEIAEGEGRGVTYNQDGSVVEEDPATTRARATRAQVRSDLKDVERGGTASKDRHAAEDAAAAKAQEAPVAPQEPAVDTEPPRNAADPETPAQPQGEPKPEEADRRDLLVHALAAMTPAEHQAYYEALGMSPQTATRIRSNGFGMNLVEKMLAALGDKVPA